MDLVELEFPFYPRQIFKDDDDDFNDYVIRSVAEKIDHVLCSVDPEILDLSEFWSELISDIGAGYYIGVE